MTREDYEALVQRLEGYATAHPDRYAVRVGVLAGLGYAYVWLVLAIATGLLAWLVRVEIRGEFRGAGMIRLTVALGLFVYTILRALWVRFEAPAGIVVGRQDVPELMALVDELVTAVRAPAFDQVVVSDDFNAAVSQQPRFGLVGGYRSYLIVGLPLAYGLTAEEFRAVLAHEVGHLSRAHGRFGAWIYRVRVMWVRLTGQLQARRTWGAWLFEWFLKRWSPYFNAYSFVLARAQEYEADRFAARLGGAEALGRALARLEVAGGWIEPRFWGGVRRRLAQADEPPIGVIEDYSAAVRGAIPLDQTARRLKQALARRTDVTDTHPSLAERLRAMGVGADVATAATVAPPRAGASAAERYFGESGDRLATLLDARWRIAVGPAWRAGHEEAVRKTTRLEELERRAAAGPLDEALQWERCELTLELNGEESAEPLLRDLLRMAPQHPFANLALGRLLLDRDDDAGLALVGLAMERHPACRKPAYELLIAYNERQGRHEEAERQRRRAWSHGDQLALAEVERQGVSSSDSFTAHELGREETRRIAEHLTAFPEIAEAYLVQKEVRHFTDMPLYVLGVRLRRPWYRYQSARWTTDVLRRIATRVPFAGQWFVVPLGPETRSIEKKLKRIEGARLLPR
ncbi:MAG TPA: M48 family metallopeptidase [Gemmatimonadales bacterium]